MTSSTPLLNEATTVDGPAPLDPARGRVELKRRLRKLHAVFDVPAIRAERIGAQDVRNYYEQCHDAFRKYHSAEGAVHMALNEGARFDADGFDGQLRLMEERWRVRSPRSVLELGFGQGFNIGRLAPRHPGVHFEGIDLAPAHLELAQRRLRERGLLNVTLQLGDYHTLPQPDASIDDAFAIEALCHAADLARVLREVARVLRPGGALTLFDGYLPKAPGLLDEDDALAVELVARGMAVERLQTVDEVLAAASPAGLLLRSQAALDRQVLPTLARLERTTDAVIRWPWLGRRALARRPSARSRNVLAGVLMRSAVSLGLVSYRYLVLEKK